MNEQQVLHILEQLRSGEIKDYRVSKSDFQILRSVLVNVEDFKYFRGNAQQGGDIIYTYEPNWTA